MVVNTKRMVNVPVKIKTGMVIGKVASFDCDAHSGRLVSVFVRTAGFVPHVLGQELVVAWSQVVSMDETEVVVVDAAISVEGKVLAHHLA